MTAQPENKTQDTQANPSQPASPRRGNILRWTFSVILMAIAIILVVITFGTDVGSRQLELLLVLALGAYFPFTYLAYRTVRAEVRRKRLEDELELLGYPKDETTWLFEQIHDQASYFLFIVLAVLTTTIGTALLFGKPPSLAITDNAVQAIRYGFLGSYLFSAFLVYRRFSTNDLHPTVYLYCAFTMIAGLVFNYVGFEAITKIASDDTAATGVGAGLLAVIAFALGYFPYLAVRWFNRLAFTSLGVDRRRTDLMPLGLIDGISEWHETRLRDTGIDDIQNLAAVEIRELLVNTAFSVQEVIEWIDQAVLYLYLEPSEIEAFRRAKIRMTSDFYVVWRSCENDDTKRDEVVLNLQSTQERLKILYSSIIEGPNVHRVLNYWKRAKSRVDENLERVAVQLGKLADITARFDATMPYLDPDVQIELIHDYGGLLSKLSPNPEVKDILNLGKLYLFLKDYDKAIEYFDAVINKFDQLAITEDLHSIAYHSRIFANAYNNNMERALGDCDALIEKTAHDPKRHLHTYIIKSYICDYFEQYDLSLQTLEKGIAIDPKYAECYNRLALHYIDHKPHTAENLTLAREHAEKALQLAPDIPDYLDTLAYAQIVYADEVEKTAQGKENLYNTAYENLQAALRSPQPIPDYGYSAISERLRHIVLYWQTVSTPQAIEYEEEVLLTALTIRTQDPMTISEIKARLKQLRSSVPVENPAQVNGSKYHEETIAVTNPENPSSEVPSEVVSAPEQPTVVPSNPTIPQ